MRKHNLWVILKVVKQRSSKDIFVEFITKSFEEKNTIQEKNVLSYTFINLGDSICYVNNLPIEPIRIGAGLNSNWKFTFPTNENEFDLTKYSFYFA